LQSMREGEGNAFHFRPSSFSNLPPLHPSNLLHLSSQTLIFPRNILHTMYLFNYPSTSKVSKYQTYIGPFKILYFFPFYFLSASVYFSSYCDVSLMSIETVVLNWEEKCISAFFFPSFFYVFEHVVVPSLWLQPHLYQIHTSNVLSNVCSLVSLFPMSMYVGGVLRFLVSFLLLT
jgi:hypothetical protein